MAELSIQEILKNQKEGSKETKTESTTKVEEPKEVEGSKEEGAKKEDTVSDPELYRGKVSNSKKGGEGKFELIKDGIYIAKLIEITDGMEKDFTLNTEIRKFRWKFEIVEGEYTGRKITKKTKVSFNEKSNTIKVYQKLNNTITENDEEVNLNECIGKTCRLDISHGTMKENTFNYVKDILTYKGK